MIAFADFVTGENSFIGMFFSHATQSFHNKKRA
jgi:hypothetical protein